MAKPTVSVIMPNYNYARFLPEALTALVCQSYRPMEIIIVDDASTDNSVDVIEKFRKEHPQIRLIRNRRNMGVVHNLNVLYQMASGDYIYGAASDDRALPGLFEQSIDTLSSHPEAALSFSDPATFENSEGPIRENRLCLTAQPSYLSPGQVVEISRRRRFDISSSGLVVKRKCLQEIGYIPELRWHADWFAWWVLAFRYGACYIPAPLATTRIHQQAYSFPSNRSRRDQVETFDAMFRFLRTNYKDVAPMFKRSAVMSCFKTPVIQAAFRDKENCRLLTPLIVARALWYEFYGIAAELTPQPIRALYRRRRVLFAGLRRNCLYSR
jgi:glycosyltransferase involved in cell wall biosynthesis